MRNIQLDKWANILVNYSLHAKKGETVYLTGTPEAMPLIEAAYEQFLLAGVSVECCITPRQFTEHLLKHGSKEQISFVPKGRLQAMKEYDLFLYIGAENNTKMLSQMDPEKQALTAKGEQPIREVVMERSSKGTMRWCLTMFPTSALAQECEMGNREYEDFVYHAGFLHKEDPVALWKELSKKQLALIKQLENKKELHFQNKDGTDLRVNIEGMKWKNCEGKINFPDGEIFTGPNLDAPCGGVNGIVRYSLPSLYKNIEFNDISLVFKNGEVIDASASKNESFLHDILSQDPRAKYVGEIAFGTNYEIQKCTKHILYDEKIGGTFHLALGAGYPETGNTNKSTIHWDIIFDLRQGGSVLADGELISKDGHFVHPEWQ